METKKEKTMTTFKSTLTSVIANIRLLSVEPYSFFILLGYIIKLVTFQNLLMDRACTNILGFDNNTCSNLDLKQFEFEQKSTIASGNNLYQGVILASSFPAVLVAIFLGPWSDKYTRKYPLIISVTGLLLESTAAIALTTSDSLHPAWYIVIALFAGFSGGFIISTSGAFSYLSDITDERSRPSRFAVLEFFNIIAIIIGNYVGGVVFDNYGYLAVLTLASSSFACGLLYTIFFIKEIKPPVPAGQRLDMFKDLLKVDNIKQSYLTCSRKRPGNLRCQIWLLIWISCCQKFSDMGTLAAGYPFAKDMYHWGVSEFSNACIVFYAVNAVVTIVGIPILSNKFQMHEAAIGLVSMLSLISKMLVTSVAYRDFMFFIAWISGTLANGVGIATRSRLSKLVRKDELGRAFSLLGTCESLTPVIGTVAFLQMFNATKDSFPGAPFAIAALILMPNVAIFLWMMKMPTVSLSEFAIEEERKQKTSPLKIISPAKGYDRLEEEKY